MQQFPHQCGYDSRKHVTGVQTSLWERRVLKIAKSVHQCEKYDSWVRSELVTVYGETCEIGFPADTKYRTFRRALVINYAVF